MYSTTRPGIDYTINSTSATHTVGTLDSGSKGTQWMFIQCDSTTAIAQYDWVCITQSASGSAAGSLFATPLTATNAASSYKVGVAQVAISTGNYGWVCVGGQSVKGHVATGVQPGAFLYASATGGIVTGTAASAVGIVGAIAMNSAASSSSVMLNLAFPHIGFLRAA